MSSKLGHWVRKFRRWVREQFRSQNSEIQESTHPGRAYESRTEINPRKIREYRLGPEFKGNPHEGSWRRYTEHLFELILEGHGRSQAAMQIRDRLNFHWRFMDRDERAQCLRFYQEAKSDFEAKKIERNIRDAQYERDVKHTRDLWDEIEVFMNPRAH